MTPFLNTNRLRGVINTMRILLSVVACFLCGTILCSFELDAREQKINVDLVGKLSVKGQVNKPRAVKYQQKITILQVITKSAGPTALADMTNVILQRNGKRYRYDLTKPTHQKVKVYGGDVITVEAK